MARITKVQAREILDSRGKPTLAARVTTSDGITGEASVPSGRSTGASETRELRDGDPGRYDSMGCRRAVEMVNVAVHAQLMGRQLDQRQLDQELAVLAGGRGAANVTTAVSLAFARTAAISTGRPLYRYFADLVGADVTTLPRPTINLFSGGEHAGGQVAIQDSLVVPMADTMDGCLAQMADVFRAAIDRVTGHYGERALRADEGGLAPAFPTTDDVLAETVRAIESAGHAPGADAAMALDVAASHFYRDGTYRLDGRSVDSAELIDVLTRWASIYPLVSIEDGLAEDDWAHWQMLAGRLGDQVLVMGDDLLCTNPARIKRAVETNAANALLLKVNQVGTLSEAAQALRLARNAEWQVTVSARSGETEDDWLADLAVGWAADYIKIGSITQSERLAKYNRLLQIETETSFPVRTPAR